MASVHKMRWGGGSFDPDIITLIAPGSRESLRMLPVRSSSTASGFVGYRFLQMDWMRGRKYASNPVPPTRATSRGSGLRMKERKRERSEQKSGNMLLVLGST